MNVKHAIHSVFPRPRSRVDWRAALPLVVFLAVFGGAAFWLDWSRTLSFTRPWMFCLLALAPWFWWMHVGGYSGLSRARSVVALLTRLSLLGVFVILLAEPRSVRSKDALTVIYAIDVSDSISDRSTEAALEFVTATVTQKPGEDDAGMIIFGGNASVELPPRQAFPLDSDEIAFNSRIDRDATNVEQALSLAAAMLPEDTRGRIVLITDGAVTEGGLSRVLDELKSREVAVDVRSVGYNYEKEVWLERLELPRFVRIGQDYEAGVVLSSLVAGKGVLKLLENGALRFEDEITWRAGKNRFTLPVRLPQAGYFEYTAVVEPPDDADTIQANNRVQSYIYVEGKGRVLVVTDPDGDSRDYERLVAALRETERVVDVQPAYQFPHDSLSLMPFDAILFVNVPADAFDPVQLQALNDAVQDLGAGFLMVGGPNSFGPGGYHRSIVEDILPVSMDVSNKKILPKGALVLVLHTCEFPQGNTWAKRITKQAIKVLGARDEAGVIAFGWNGGDSWVFPLTPASEFDKMARLINAAEIGDMPSFVPSMQMGLAALKNSDASARHMIVISDGDAQPPSPALLQQYKNNQISVTTVSVFPHGGNEQQVMAAIANATGGRAYRPQSAEALPKIFIKEAKTLKRGMIQESTEGYVPQGGMPSSVLKGITEAPKLYGYVLTTPKNRAEVVLKAPGEDESQVDPLLALGRHGLGRTAAMTSDLSPRWGSDWLAWDKYKAFVKQLATEVSRVKNEGHIRLWAEAAGNEAVIVVEDYHREEAFLTVTAKISGPDERSETVVMQQVAPRRYQTTVPLWGRGRYQVAAVGKAGERTDRAQGGFIISYSPEYLRFRSNPILLKEIVDKTDGRMLERDAALNNEWAEAAETIYKTRRAPKTSTRPIFDWFLIALCCLLPLDVGVRRIQIDWAAVKNRFGIGGRKGPSTETMGALLQRKKAVESDLDARREDRPLRPLQPTRPQDRSEDARARSRPKQEEPSQPPTDQDAPTTTMARLLEMKRRREEEERES